MIYGIEAIDSLGSNFGLRVHPLIIVMLIYVCV